MAQKVVLVVEDETVLSKILQQTLEREGYETLAAMDGKEGLTMALEKKPDLILLDIMMPHDGLTMLASLRQNKEYGQHVPVILLTNLSPDSNSIIESVEKYEPVFYLVKANHSPEQVVAKVQEALEKN